VKAADDINELISETIAKGEDLFETRFSYAGIEFVDAEGFHEFIGDCRLILKKLEPMSDIWLDGIPTDRSNHYVSALMAQGTIRSIGDALQKGRLTTARELATAEILADLLEQADILASSKYYRASAVILRAILEERLRKLCEANNCMPSQNRPTIEHYKQRLYSANVIDKVVQKRIDWMAGVGNAAAHNLSDFRDADVPTLYKDILDFLARFSA
jgi:Domain of unknown function (DUF4145)